VKARFVRLGLVVGLLVAGQSLIFASPAAASSNCSANLRITSPYFSGGSVVAIASTSCRTATSFLTLRLQIQRSDGAIIASTWPGNRPEGAGQSLVAHAAGPCAYGIHSYRTITEEWDSLNYNSPDLEFYEPWVTIGC
jgi:hypothetical protein